MLSVVGEFISRSSTRLSELAKKQSMNDTKNVELLDFKSHVRLAEIAHSLLKVSPYDPDTMACRGLQRYLLHSKSKPYFVAKFPEMFLLRFKQTLDFCFLKDTCYSFCLEPIGQMTH